MAINRKEQEVDLLKLFALSDLKTWHAMIDRCVAANDANYLGRIRYGIQVSMDKLAKQKLNSDKLRVFFIQRYRDLYKAAKKIIRNINPSPCDNPLVAASMRANNPKEYTKYIVIKRKRDNELEKWEKRTSF